RAIISNRGMTVTWAGMPRPSTKNTVSGPAERRRTRLRTYAAGAETASVDTEPASASATVLAVARAKPPSLHAVRQFSRCSESGSPHGARKISGVGLTDDRIKNAKIAMLNPTKPHTRTRPKEIGRASCRDRVQQ